MADIRAEDLTQETKSTLDGSEQFIMFDSTEGKRGTVSDVGDYILQNGDADGQGNTVAEMIAQVPTGDEVSYTQTQTSGNELGTITINGTGRKIYAPAETDPVYSASPAAGITSANISAWNGKQDELVSGTNIKTINNISVLGSGNINIEGGGGGASQNVWYATCPTGASTTAKVVTTTSGDFALTSGNMVRVTFTNANTASATLNVDGSGAISARMVSGSSTTAYYWSAGETVDFVYNGTYFLASGKGTATTTYYGVTKLTSSTSSTSTSLAATGSAVKAAYDLANGKQDALVSGTNIKTINNETILGSGNITVQGGASVTSTQVSITVANWNATTTCTKSVTGVTASNDVIIAPDPASISDYTSAGVYCSAQASGTLTFTAASTPTADLTVNVMIAG